MIIVNEITYRGNVLYMTLLQQLDIKVISFTAPRHLPQITANSRTPEHKTHTLRLLANKTTLNMNRKTPTTTSRPVCTRDHESFRIRFPGGPPGPLPLILILGLCLGTFPATNASSSSFIVRFVTALPRRRLVG
jgi:hypothetical protein